MKSIQEILKQLLAQIQSDGSGDYEQLKSMLGNLFVNSDQWKISHSFRISGQGLYSSILNIQTPDADFEHYLSIEVQSKLKVDDTKLEITEISEIESNIKGVHYWDNMQEVEDFDTYFTLDKPNDFENQILEALKNDVFKQYLIKAISAEIF